MANANATADRGDIWRPDPPPFGLADLVALLAWTVAVLAVFWDAATLRGAFFYFDVTEINYSYRDFLAHEIRSGRFSRWFPGVYCGLPLYSESQAGYLHPLKWLLYPWLPTWQAFNLDTVISVWLTGAGTFGWLRRHVGPRGALAGAAVFGFSGFVWAHLIHTSMNNALSSVPFAVWALEWAWAKKRLAGVALGALAVAFQVFAGHLQDTLLTAGLLGAYGLYHAATERTAGDRLKALGIAAGVIVLGASLSAVQWIPSKELLDRSPRAGGLAWDDLTYGSWHPELLPTLVVREAYGTRARDTDWMDGFYPYHEMNAYLGLTALALAVIGAAAYRDRWVAFWVLLAGLAGLLMLGRYTFLFDFAHKIPVVGSSRIPVRFHLWFSLAVAALAAVGVDRLGQAGPCRVRLRGAVGLMLGMTLVSVPILLYAYTPALNNPGRWSTPYHAARYHWLGRELVVSSLRTLAVTLAGIAAMAVAARARTIRLRDLACAALPLIIIVDLLGAHWNDAPTVPPAYWTKAPESARKIKADPAFVRVFGVAEKSAGEPGYASETVDFLGVRDTLDWSLPPVWGLASSNGKTPIFPRRMLTYTDHAKPGSGRYDVESVTHLVVPRRMRVDLPKFAAAGRAMIYRNPNAQPRARLMGRPVYAGSEAEAAAALTRLGRAVRDRVVVEDPERPLSRDAEPEGTAAIVKDEPESVTVSVRSGKPAYLVLADTFDPGWSATLDGRPAPIRPAFVAFRAVYVPEGSHEVRFTYRPAGFTAGLAVSAVALVVALALVVWPRRFGPDGDEHGPSSWPDRWPAWGLAAVVLILAASTIGLGPDGRPHLQGRWKGSFHTFTWGSGIEAMSKASRG